MVLMRFEFLEDDDDNKVEDQDCVAEKVDKADDKAWAYSDDVDDCEDDNDDYNAEDDADMDDDFDDDGAEKDD